MKFGNTYCKLGFGFLIAAIFALFILLPILVRAEGEPVQGTPDGNAGLMVDALRPGDAVRWIVAHPWKTLGTVAGVGGVLWVADDQGWLGNKDKDERDEGVAAPAPASTGDGSITVTASGNSAPVNVTVVIQPAE